MKLLDYLRSAKVDLLLAGVLYVGSVLAVKVLDLAVQPAALEAASSFFKVLAMALAGGHIGIAAAGGGGVGGMVKSLLTSARPYEEPKPLIRAPRIPDIGETHGQL